jgi:hypothetical protein
MEDQERPDQDQRPGLLITASLLLLVTVAGPLAVLLLWEIATDMWNMVILGARWLEATARLICP